MFVGFNAAYFLRYPPCHYLPALAVVCPLFRFNVKKWREHTFLTEPGPVRQKMI
jgi:hypothetical protein